VPWTAAENCSGRDGPPRRLRLARYNTDGSLDTTFGTDGKVTTDFSGEFGDQAYAVAIDSSEKIVVAGTVFWENAFGLARYLAGEANLRRLGHDQRKGGGDRSREVTLTLTASDDTPGAIRMCISNTDTCEHGQPLPQPGAGS